MIFLLVEAISRIQYINIWKIISNKARQREREKLAVALDKVATARIWDNLFTEKQLFVVLSAKKSSLLRVPSALLQGARTIRGQLHSDLNAVSLPSGDHGTARPACTVVSFPSLPVTPVQRRSSPMRCSSAAFSVLAWPATGPAVSSMISSDWHLPSPMSESAARCRT